MLSRIFDEGISLLTSYFNPIYNNMRIIEKDTQYMSSLNANIQESIILLKAQLGGGKTASIVKFIKDHNYKRILFVSVNFQELHSVNLFLLNLTQPFISIKM